MHWRPLNPTGAADAVRPHRVRGTKLWEALPTVTVRGITGWIPRTREVLDDVAFLEAQIRARLGTRGSLA